MGEEQQGILSGKRGLIIGVANEWSIAWGIAKVLRSHGATNAFTWQDERFERRLNKVFKKNDYQAFSVRCDVTKDEEIQGACDAVAAELGGIDFLIHSVAFAQREDLEGRFLNVSRDGYALAQDISAYSLVATSRAVEPHFPEGGGSIVTMTYLGGGKVVPGYNTMGVAKAALESVTRYLAYDLGERRVRVNAISAGPIKTLAASGVSGFDDVLEYVEKRAPLKRNVSTEEVGGVAAFLVSDLSTGVTGEVIHVDSGYHAMGL